jgi:hemerythrin-like domain-containing protein
MKATSLLEKQHRKVEALFKKLLAGKADPAPLLVELANDLAAHMAIEQDIFYPAIRRVKPDLVEESFEEHAVAELEMKRLLATSPTEAAFKARVKTLSELIDHHVEEEEEELFPAVEKALPAEQLVALGKQMKAEFEAKVSQGFAALLPKAFSKTTADAARRNLPKAPPKHRANGHAAHAR